MTCLDLRQNWTRGKVPGMIGFYAMCLVLVLIGAALTYGMVEAGGFWGALIIAGCFAAITATVAC